MNHLTKRCGCGSVFALAHLKDRSSQCVACQRRDARGLNERRPGLWLEWRCASDNPGAFIARFGVLDHGKLFRLVAYRSGDWSAKAVWSNASGAKLRGFERDLRCAQIQAERAAACMALCSYAERFKWHVRRRKNRGRNGSAVRTQLGRATWRGDNGQMFEVGVRRKVVGSPAIPQRTAPNIYVYTSCLRALAADHENVLAMVEDGSFVRAAIEWEEE